MHCSWPVHHCMWYLNWEKCAWATSAWSQALIGCYMGMLIFHHSWNIFQTVTLRLNYLIISTNSVTTGSKGVLWTDFWCRHTVLRLPFSSALMRTVLVYEYYCLKHGPCRSKGFMFTTSQMPYLFQCTTKWNRIVTTTRISESSVVRNLEGFQCSLQRQDEVVISLHRVSGHCSKNRAIR